MKVSPTRKCAMESCKQVLGIPVPTDRKGVSCSLRIRAHECVLTWTSGLGLGMLTKTWRLRLCSAPVISNVKCVFGRLRIFIGLCLSVLWVHFDNPGQILAVHHPSECLPSSILPISHHVSNSFPFPAVDSQARVAFPEPHSCFLRRAHPNTGPAQPPPGVRPQRRGAGAAATGGGGGRGGGRGVPGPVAGGGEGPRRRRPVRVFTDVPIIFSVLFYAEYFFLRLSNLV